MTEQTTPAEPRYGVVTCGKPAPEPAAALLGVCIHEPEHEGKCRFKAPPIPGDAYVEIDVVEGRRARHRLHADINEDPAIAGYRKMLRTNARISAVLTVFLFALFIYQLLQAFDVI